LPGIVVFQTGPGGDIVLVSADGRRLSRLTDGMDPALSPDGNRLVFARWGAPHCVLVLDLPTGQEQRVVSGSEPRSPTWSSDGSHLAFNYTTRSYTCRFSPFGCLENDALRATFGGQDCITTPGERLCMKDLPEGIVQQYGLVQVDSAGGSWQDLPAQQTVQASQWQPGSGEIVYRGDRGLQVTSVFGPTRPLTDDISLSGPAWSPDAPTWSPDGRHILFLTDRDRSWGLYRMDAAGSNQRPCLPGVLRDIPLRYEFAAERVATWGQ
jgi:TolB protein